MNVRETKSSDAAGSSSYLKASTLNSPPTNGRSNKTGKSLNNKTSLNRSPTTLNKKHSASTKNNTLGKNTASLVNSIRSANSSSTKLSNSSSAKLSNSPNSSNRKLTKSSNNKSKTVSSSKQSDGTTNSPVIKEETCKVRKKANNNNNSNKRRKKESVPQQVQAEKQEDSKLEVRNLESDQAQFDSPKFDQQFSTVQPASDLDTNNYQQVSFKICVCNFLRSKVCSFVLFQSLLFVFLLADQ